MIGASTKDPCSACCATERSIPSPSPSLPLALYSHYSRYTHNHTEHHRTSPPSTAPMMQYYSNPQMNAVMQGGMGMGMGANQGMMGQNLMLGMQGMGSYGQAWRNLAS